MVMYNGNLRRALEDDAYAHMYLCHSDGSACADGCDRRAHPDRLRAYEAEGRSDAYERGDIDPID